MKIKFKIADENHIAGIVHLCNTCFLENTDVVEAKKRFIETKNDQNQIYLIGECDGEIIAHTKITIVPTIFKGMDTYAILNHVCVKESMRKHKIGTKMLEATKIICQKMHCTSIKLWSNNIRIPAHTCYKKFGFQKEDASFFSLDI